MKQNKVVTLVMWSLRSIFYSPGILVYFVCSIIYVMINRHKYGANPELPDPGVVKQLKGSSFIIRPVSFIMWAWVMIRWLN